MRQFRKLIPIAIILLLSAAISSVAWASIILQEQRPAGVPESRAGCREDPMAHVYRPSRLTVVQRCAAVSGTVRRVQFDATDGNTKLWVELDAHYTHVLEPSNKGLLQVEVIPTDHPAVYIPRVGEQVTIHGALVLYKGHTKRVAIHPAWLITTAQVTGTAIARTTLEVVVDGPKAVPVGDQTRFSITVRSRVAGSLRPQPQTRLWLELRAEAGQVVRWEYALTNPLGVANLNLAGLEVPGDYTVWVYAYKGSDTGTGETAFTIRRR